MAEAVDNLHENDMTKRNLEFTDENIEYLATELRPPHINALLDEMDDNGSVEIEIDYELDLIIYDV